MKRILFDCLLFLSPFIFPWWMAFGIAVVGLVLFSSYYEALILGIIVDSLYNAPIARFHGLEFAMTFLLVCAFVIIEVLKRNMTFYSRR